MIEVDLQDSDGMIVSVAQADPNVWAGIGAQATQLVAQAPGGFNLIVYDRVFNSPERTLDSIGAVQNWLAAQSNVGGAKRPATAPTAAPAPAAGLDLPVPLPLAGAAAGALLGLAFGGLLGAAAGGLAGWWAGRKLAAKVGS